jgi:hypothetical protein
MSRLAVEIEAALQPGMVLPDPLRQLFAWIEANRYFSDQKRGNRVGFLFPEADLRAGWTGTERPGGTIIEFAAEGSGNLGHWFGHSNQAVQNRLCVFAQTGADGSMAAFWLAPDGAQKIVHLGSGSGSTLVCVLADAPVDFLRLLAIGYDEICWSEEYGRPPNAAPCELVVHPNVAFQHWVRDTFGVGIPTTALEIVAHPAELGDASSPDPFCRWVEQNSWRDGPRAGRR